MKLRKRKYLAFLAGAALAWPVVDALLTLSIHRGFDPPRPHPFERGVWIIERDLMSAREWHDFSRKYPIFLALTWLFVTSGATTTLPTDFNIFSNQFNAIGAGVPGSGGTTGVACVANGPGGNGGGAGAFASIANYSAHGAGAVVNIQVGAGDTFFDSISVLLAKAGSGTTGGQASASVGSIKFNGGGGGAGGSGCAQVGSGGGGGGAGGPNGQGSTGGNGTIFVFSAATGGAGGNADGNTVGGGAGGTSSFPNGAVGSNGTEFGPNATSQFAGCGGGGGGGASAAGAASPGGGGNSGAYGGGGGGGGGSGASNPVPGGSGGNSFQGFIGYSYTPTVISGVRNFGFILG
jgi:hypothetical protein